MIWTNHGILATTFITLYVGHQLADYWLQTHTQATRKANPGWGGRLACARHVAVLTATQALLLAAVSAGTGMGLEARWVGAGLALNAVTHYWADRRTPLARLADWLQRTRLVPGKGTFARLGDPAAAPTGTGAHALDQAWHLCWLLPTAWLCVIGPGWGLLT